jgi:hypothetical protein
MCTLLGGLHVESGGVNVDAAAEFLKEIVPVPEAVELQSLPERNNAIERTTVQISN